MICEYEKQYMHDYGFEKVMVWARQKYIEGLIRQLKPATVVEIGCGFDQLFTHVADLSSIKQWTIVEPSDIFSAAAREKLKDDARVDVIQAFVENVPLETNPSKADLCICAGLLHEVERPDLILQAARKTLSLRGVLHLSVPNAKSFHRQLAVAMGLIPSPYQRSDRNVTLSQYHVFDAGSLRALAEKAGLEATEAGGYFIKPFTHTQMEKVVKTVGDGMLNGLWHMGIQYPELASEIYLNTRKG
jgi:SAM-dependent methyltransferase